MKKFSKILAYLLLLSSMVLPILPVVAGKNTPKPAQLIELNYGTMTTAFDWDIIGPGYGVLTTQYSPNIRETLIATNDDIRDHIRDIALGTDPGPRTNYYIPVLATDWQIDYYDNVETNSEGFRNFGGVENVTFTLRENVTFHDGSEWNATVCKWNIDRMMLVMGNFTGNGDSQYHYSYFGFGKAKEWAKYFTDAWNRSEFVDAFPTYHDGTTFYRSQDPAVFGKIPVVRNVTIIEDDPHGLGGGTVKITWNSWNSYVLEIVGTLPMISMHTYKDFYDRGIYKDSFPDDWTVPGNKHLVGTGAYMFDFHDDTTSPAGGRMIKNPNWWNRTAMEARGWDCPDVVNVYTWPVGLGTDSYQTAMETHVVDMAADLFQWPLDYDFITTHPHIVYLQQRAADYITSITLNCINQTWMTYPGWDGVMGGTPTSIYGVGAGKARGVPKAIRAAMSYAFDYDGYISQVWEGRADRPTSFIGAFNAYTNNSVPIATTNIDKARRILLTDEPDFLTEINLNPKFNFSKLCADAGLTNTSTEAEWIAVAEGPNPLWKLDFHWDTFFEPLRAFLRGNLKKIGVALSDPPQNFVSTYMWDKVSTYYAATFPVFSAHAWPLDWNYPGSIVEGWIWGNYQDPNQGSWRTDPLFWYSPDWNWFPWYDLNFAYDSDVDHWISRMFLSNETGKMKFISRIADKVQNELYPMIWLAQHRTGLVHWDEWEMSDYWGWFNFARTKYVGSEEVSEPISGYLIPVVVTVSMAALLSVVYVTMKKKKYV
ncbi:MAG: ABC transporter substrate-binding protein [Candidatus Thorarchaeota archaeon]